MTSRHAALAALAVALAVAAIVILLATGGDNAADPFVELPGDVTVDEGSGAPPDGALADVLFADVRAEGEELVFEVRLGAEIPRRLKGSSLDLRWDVYEGQTPTWIVAANLNVGPIASVLSQDASFGVSTFDDSLVGGIEREDDRLLVHFDPRTIEGFPEAFSWQLTSVLDGAPGDPASPLARDRTPEEGRREFAGG